MCGKLKGLRLGNLWLEPFTKTMLCKWTWWHYAFISGNSRWILDFIHWFAIDNKQRENCHYLIGRYKNRYRLYLVFNAISFDLALFGVSPSRFDPLLRFLSLKRTLEWFEIIEHAQAQLLFKARRDWMSEVDLPNAQDNQVPVWHFLGKRLLLKANSWRTHMNWQPKAILKPQKYLIATFRLKRNYPPRPADIRLSYIYDKQSLRMWAILRIANNASPFVFL